MRMYLITRKDLSKSQQAVQSSHALAAYCLALPNIAHEWNNHTLIALTVQDEAAMCSLMDQLSQLGHSCIPFREPYYDNALTAFAVCDPVVIDRLKFLPLM